jgi:Protein of unknown function (DUF1236)
MKKHCEEKSMTNRFLISVAAAALIAGTGFANAQGAGGMKNEGGSTAQQSAPPSGGGAAQPQHRESQQPGMKSGQSEKAPGAGKEAQDMKGGKDKSTVGQAPDKSGATTQREDKMGRDKEKKSGTVGQAPEKGGAATKGHDDKMGQDKMGQGREDKMGQPSQKGSTEPKGAQQNQGAPDTKGAQTSPQQGGAQTTTGAVTSARVAAPPPEKQTQIVSAIKSERIQETTNVNVNISVGTVLPATVRFHPLPPRIVEIYPEWRGFEVIFIHGRYVIVRPQTREIVYIIEG